MAFYSTYGQPFLSPYEDYEQDAALSSVNKPILWTSGSQPLVNPVSSQLAGWTKFGLGVGALALFGRANLGGGYRGFDAYIGAARALEEYGPGRIFRTFQLSHMLSPLEVASRQYRYWSPSMIRGLKETPAGRTWIQHIERLTGQGFGGGSRLLEEGFRFEEGKLLYGQTGSDVLLSRAGIIRSPMGVSPTFQEGYARSLAGTGVKGLRQSLTQKIPYLTAEGDLASEAMFLTGGHTRAQAAGRFLSGYGTSLVERFNRLVAAPAEFYPKFFPGHELINKIGKALSVEPSSGLKTFGKLGLKLGIGLPLAYAGYDLADWGVRQVFGKGITETAATLYTQGHVMFSRMAEITGGHRLREWQEETAPGSTTLTRLAAFPVMGGLAGATIGYAGRLARMGAYRLGGYSLQEASVMAGAEKSFMLKALYGETIPEEMGALLTPSTREMVENQTQRILSGWTGKIARGIAVKQETGGFLGGLTKILGKVTPGKIRGLIGAGIGLGLVAPFIPGALVPDKRPEELERIYSGKQLVPIKRGRWWEFGTCNTSESLIFIDFLTNKPAREITLEDTLLGNDGQPHPISNIFQRKHKGPIVKIYTAIDRNISTGLTLEHIVPVISHGTWKYDIKTKDDAWVKKIDREIKEIKAGDIQVGDFVKVPISKIKNDLKVLNLETILSQVKDKQSKWENEGGKIYGFQQKRTGGFQKTKSIPLPVHLQLSEDVGRLFGYYLAEGSISFIKNKAAYIELVFSIHEEKYIEDVKQICLKSFNILPTIRKKTTGKKTKEGCWIVRICHSLLSAIFYMLFHNSVRGRHKYFPKIFFDTVDDFKKGIIEGYFRGDGWWKEERKYIGASDRKKSLLEAVKVLLLQFGYTPSIPKIDWSSGYIRKDGTLAGKVSIGWDPRYQYANTQSFIWKNKELWTQVIKIEQEEYDGSVYDFEIDEESHLLVNGTFFVHNSPWEGQRTDRYVPSWFVRLHMRARSRDPYGGRDLPLLYRLYKENMTYDVEQENYYRRPYPTTAPAFSGVPLIGPLLSSTLGRIVKPPRLMHTEEMFREGPGDQQEIKEMPLRYGDRPAFTGLGELGSGMPISPYGAKGTISEQAYRLQEQVGLPGFTIASIKEAITGHQGLFDQEQRLQSAANMYGLAGGFYEEEMGGMAGCFIKGTSVKTDKGNLSIEKIKIGDRVLTDNGFRQVENVFINQEKTPLVKVKIGSFGLEFVCTENHKLPIIRRHCYNSKSLYRHPKPFESRHIDQLEVCAVDLLPDDLVCYPIDRTEQNHTIDLAGTGKSTTDQYVYLKSSLDFALAYESLENNPFLTRKDLRNQGLKDKNIKEAIRQFRYGPVPLRINRFISVDENIAYIVGWYIAEGSVDRSRGSIQYNMHANEKEYAEEILRIFNSLGYNGSIDIQDNSLVLRVSASCLSRYFEIFGCEAHIKHIPSEYKHLPLLQLQRMVDGLLIGDGWRKKDSWRGGFTSVSKQLTLDLADCLLRLGIPVHLCLDYFEKVKGDYPQGKPKKNTLRQYLTINKGREGWRFFQDSYLLPVKTIEHLENNEEYTYDLEVEDRHYYTANGVLVHNSNEAFRRLFPRPRKIPEWNAIPNEFSNVSWLPGEGDRSPNFRTGDPFRAVPQGELRLPGPMYERLHPELAGLDPNEYPTMARYRILADIAPYSDKFKEASIQIASAIKYKQLTKEEEEEVKEIKRQIKERKERKQFWDYKYREKSLTPVQEVLTAANEASKEDKSPSWFQSVVGGYWETLAHSAETPMEYATPFSPASKFVHMRTATEDYEKNIYGSESRFWQHPIRDFLRPFLTSTAHAFGWQGVPSGVERRRDIEEYFDILKYMKFTRLKNAAQMSGNIEATDEFESRRRETLFGINPFTMNYKQVFRALPRRERDYYNAFMKADMEERAKIVDMVPENEKAFYIARWQQQDAQDIKKAVSKGLLNDKQLQEAEAELKRLYEQKETEGMPKDQELWAEYLATRMRGESYPDWYRRTKLLEERLGGRDLPGPNWCCPGDTKILTKKGYVDIQQVNIGDYVWTEKGYRAVLQKYEREINEEVIDIYWSQDTFHSQIITKEHPVFVNNQWKLAKDIKVKDILSPVDYNVLSPTQEIDIFNYLPQEKYKIKDDLIVNRRGPLGKINRFISTDEDFYWLLGIYLAEGNIRFSENRMRGIEFTLNLDEWHIAEKIRRIISDKFNKEVCIKKRYRNTGHCLSVIVHCQLLGYLFIGLCGRYSDKKNPHFIPGSIRQLLLVVDGYFEGDGTVRDIPGRASSTSYQISMWNRDILTSSGIYNSFARIVRKNRKIQYKSNLLVQTNWQAREVVDVQRIHFKGKVFNLTVDEVNEFYTPLGKVHNCGWHSAVMLDDVKLKVIESLGENPIDYDIWPDQQRTAAKRPYLEAAAQEVPMSERSNHIETQAKIKEILSYNNISADQVAVIPIIGASGNRIDINLSESRDNEVREMIRRGKLIN